MRTVSLRITDEDYEKWKGLSGEGGLSGWIREKCNDNRISNVRKEPSVHKAVGRQPAAEVGNLGTSSGHCTHDYKPGGCPFPSCENYKWRK